MKAMRKATPFRPAFKPFAPRHGSVALGIVITPIAIERLLAELSAMRQQIEIRLARIADTAIGTPRYRIEVALEEADPAYAIEIWQRIKKTLLAMPGIEPGEIEVIET